MGRPPSTRWGPFFVTTIRASLTRRAYTGSSVRFERGSGARSRRQERALEPQGPPGPPAGGEQLPPGPGTETADPPVRQQDERGRVRVDGAVGRTIGRL